MPTHYYLYILHKWLLEDFLLFKKEIIRKQRKAQNQRAKRSKTNH